MIRVTRPGDPVAVSETETAEWLVERLADGTLRVTVFNDDGHIVQHGGVTGAVRSRLARDAAARHRAAIDQEIGREPSRPR